MVDGSLPGDIGRGDRSSTPARVACARAGRQRHPPGSRPVGALTGSGPCVYCERSDAVLILAVGLALCRHCGNPVAAVSGRGATLLGATVPPSRVLAPP